MWPCLYSLCVCTGHTLRKGWASELAHGEHTHTNTTHLERCVLSRCWWASGRQAVYTHTHTMKTRFYLLAGARAGDQSLCISSVRERGWGQTGREGWRDGCQGDRWRKAKARGGYYPMIIWDSQYLASFCCSYNRRDGWVWGIWHTHTPKIKGTHKTPKQEHQEKYWLCLMAGSKHSITTAKTLTHSLSLTHRHTHLDLCPKSQSPLSCFQVFLET